MGVSTGTILPKSAVPFQGSDLPKVRLISVSEYDQMIQHGILTDEDKVELLNGEIIQKMTKGTRHSSTNDRLSRLFYRLFDESVDIRNQNPIWLHDFSEPEPDIVLAKHDENFYADRHPVAEDIFVVIEIADTSVQFDRFTKGRIYAEAGIQQYVLLNLIDFTVEDYRSPEPDGYDTKQTYHRGESFSLAAFPDIQISVDDLF